MTRTETAIRALVTAIATAAALPAAKIPKPSRNQDLVSRLIEVGDATMQFVNVRDGAPREREEMLGADFGAGAGREITQICEIEYAVAGADDDARETAFDDGRQAIWDAIKPAASGGSVTYLGGAVDALTLDDIIPHDETVAAGLPNVKACTFLVALTFTSSDPF